MFKTQTKKCINCGHQNGLLIPKCVSCSYPFIKKIQGINDNSIIFKRMQRLILVRDDFDLAAVKLNELPENVMSYLDKKRYLYLLVTMIVDNDCETCLEYLELLINGQTNEVIEKIPNMISHLAAYEESKNLVDIEEIQGIVYKFNIVRKETEEIETESVNDLLTDIPLNLINDADDINCVICMEKYSKENNDKIVSLPCGHIYHKKCITEWLKHQDKCPLGRCIIAPLPNLISEKIKIYL